MGAAFAVVLCLSGCHHGPTPEFPDWVGRYMQQEPARDGTNAYTGYAHAAEEAEANGRKYLDMVSFYPAQRASAMKLTEGALATLKAAASEKCSFDFQPGNPFKAPSHQRGWRLLGRDLVWKIQEAIQVNDFGTAVENANLATKFGFDISGGGATDASLGLAIANEARQAIAPAMDRMDAAQLGSLAEGTTRALDSKPDLSETIEHEHENMLESVQVIQDAYRNESLDVLRQNLGPDARSSVEFLDELHRKDYSKRPQYFADFAAEADSEANWMKSVSDKPAIDRVSTPEPKFSSERPWKKFSKELFSSLKPLLTMNDATLARTRLLILESLILQQVKTSGSAPKDLSQFAESLKTDPYTGKPFIYGSDGADYHVYSVGEDFRDDGGETDETFTQPDLKLEKED
jgi:hypothetical protein